MAYDKNFLSLIQNIRAFIEIWSSRYSQYRVNRLALQHHIQALFPCDTCPKVYARVAIEEMTKKQYTQQIRLNNVDRNDLMIMPQHK